jgi:alanyl-tRNA synthetase
LRETVDHFRDKLAPAAVVLGSVNDGKVALVAGVTKDLVTRVNSGELAKHLAAQFGGRGGGRADMAEAGGGDPDRLDRALQEVSPWMKDRL